MSLTKNVSDKDSTMQKMTESWRDQNNDSKYMHLQEAI